MASIADRVLDNGLTVLDTEANRVDLTSQEATSYAEATSTYTLGNKTSISIGAPTDRTGGGRKVTQYFRNIRLVHSLAPHIIYSRFHI